MVFWWSPSHRGKIQNQFRFRDYFVFFLKGNSDDLFILLYGCFICEMKHLCV